MKPADIEYLNLQLDELNELQYNPEDDLALINHIDIQSRVQ